MYHGQSREVVEALRQGGIVALDEKDMFSLWVKTSCCNMNTDQLRKLADIADRYGRGYVLFTTRQTPHIPFINLKDVADVKQELAKVELELDRCGPRVRNLNVCYEPKLCSSAKTDCISLGERLENFFRNEIVHKVKLGVAGCERDCIGVRALADIGFIGKSTNGFEAYDAYVGGRLGVNPFVGVKMGQDLSQAQCVRFVQNYIDVLAVGMKGERAADLIKRLGERSLGERLNAGLENETSYQPVPCPTRVGRDIVAKANLRVRALCGEVTSQQLRKIAELADEHALGIVHFGVRGAPEIPAADVSQLSQIKTSLIEAGLSLLEGDTENLQSCYAGYCTEGLADGQSLLRRLEQRMADSHFDTPGVTISASGCPNSCGIAHLSDLGFHGVAETEVDSQLCTGCEMCLPVCKRKAIKIQNKVAVIDQSECRNCGQCIGICPMEAIQAKRKGFAVLVGGTMGKDMKLGQTIAEYLSEDQAFELGSRCLSLAQARGTSIGAIVEEKGLEGFRKLVARS